tara:strand:- start:406 stop:969 length:564 start_codon:yes stop_codon:yes gene_type:complete
MSKEEARKHITALVKNMSATEKLEASEAVSERLRSLASIKFADIIFSYFPLENEVCLLSLMRDWIDESVTVAVPLTNWENKTIRAGLVTSLDANELVETRHNIKEPIHRHPIPTDSVDIILVPGVGFNANGTRLGKGGGFYDRFLEHHRPPIVLGIAFDEQIVDTIPSEEHDQKMTAVITPTRTMLC